ncbi:MAG: VOC family protein [Pyrinomonadaceae bacterium]
MAEINPYLILNGDCGAAFDFYRSVFGGEFTANMKFSDLPGDNPCSTDDESKILHVSLPVGRGTILMGSDCPSSQPPVDMGNNIMLSISPDSKEDADRIFAALTDGGVAKLPMQDMFWGAYFGMLTDRFGISWQINFDLKQAAG